MAWGWAKKPAETVTATLGLDINSSRVRAVAGPPSGAAPRVVALEHDQPELPMVIQLDGRTPTVGWTGVEHVRLLPHLVCRDFLVELGRPRDWQTRCGRLDASGAMAIVADALKVALPSGHGVVLVTPPFLLDQQVGLIIEAIRKTGFSVLGGAPAPLALAATCDAGFGTALVLDADDHALTWSVLQSDGTNARWLSHHDVGAASVRGWYDRLIDAVSDRCVRLCRRDPRDSAMAEQSLFEQLIDALSAPISKSPFSLSIRTTQWFQELTATREDLELWGAPLAKIAVEGMRHVVAAAHTHSPVMARPELLWVTADAARLPGLVEAAAQHVPESTAIQVLPPDALATAGYVLAGHFLRGDLPRGQVSGTVPRFAVKSGATSPRRDPSQSRSQRI